jgi:anti-sigma regulatory factor (Ser/Thr protein kinase)
MTERRRDRAGTSGLRRGGPATPGPSIVETLLDDLDAGRGARDAVVLPVTSTDAMAVSEVRSTLQTIIDDALPLDSQQEVQLVSSELVTNAIEHGLPPVKYVLHETDEAVVIAVFDRGDGAPLPTPPQTPGLRIVDDLTSGRWGVVHRKTGKWVWAVVARAAGPAT